MYKQVVDWIAQLLHANGREGSKDVARKRLQFVLIHDRIGMPSETLEAMKNELLQVISKYLVINPESIEVEVKHSGDSVILVSNIRVSQVRPTSAT